MFTFSSFYAFLLLHLDHALPDQAEITELANQIVDQGTNATLSCKVDANPKKADMITWERTGYDLAANALITYADGVSSLTILSADKADSGVFTCKANNSIGEISTKTGEFIVKCKYMQRHKW